MFSKKMLSVSFHGTMSFSPATYLFSRDNRHNIVMILFIRVFFFITEHDKSAAPTAVNETSGVDEKLDGTEAVMGGKACSRHVRAVIGHYLVLYRHDPMLFFLFHYRT
jgi:hypothetical protein